MDEQINEAIIAKCMEGDFLEEKELKKIIKAKCYDCNCDYVDGKYDCLVPKCPLYPYSPYKGVEPCEN